MAIVTVLDDYQQVALASADWGPVQALHTVEVLTEHVGDDAELVRRLGPSEIVVAMRERTRFGADLLAQLANLRLLITTGMVNASIDMEAAARLGIVVAGTGASGNSMPELTIGMMIALTRNFAQEDAAVRAGRWQHTIGPGLAGSTLGIVGLGRLGAPVAKLAKVFEMDVIAWSPNLTPERAEPHGVRAASKAELFSTADIVTIHMPLSSRSRGLVGAEDLGRMKPTAYLINTSRGPIVDEEALIDALAHERIAGAGLDVYDVEPLPVDHRLRSLRNTLLLPHIGYVTSDQYRTFYGHAVEDIVAYSAGTPIRVLNGSRP
jgi:phosphoglycerate dehydrogenase-like enzyme